jgi:hypothetical protein
MKTEESTAMAISAILSSGKTSGKTLLSPEKVDRRSKLTLVRQHAATLGREIFPSLFDTFLHVTAVLHL